MKLGIMQPYFLPYIGYWQLINVVDEFVIYDNIQYTKKGWINKNRYLLNGKDAIFTVNLKKDSDYLNVNQRFISPEYKRSKLIAVFSNAYNNAPMKKEILPIVESIINYEESNLFGYILNSITKICEHLNIDTKITVSSKIDIDHSLKAEQKVIAICKALHADTYVNLSGGIELYTKENFEKENIQLKFIKSKSIYYEQLGNTFIEWLSIVDVLMFNTTNAVIDMLDEYNLFS